MVHLFAGTHDSFKPQFTSVYYSNHSNDMDMYGHLSTEHGNVQGDFDQHGDFRVSRGGNHDVGSKSGRSST